MARVLERDGAGGLLSVLGCLLIDIAKISSNKSNVFRNEIQCSSFSIFCISSNLLQIPSSLSHIIYLIKLKCFYCSFRRSSIAPLATWKEASERVRQESILVFILRGLQGLHLFIVIRVEWVYSLPEANQVQPRPALSTTTSESSPSPLSQHSPSMFFQRAITENAARAAGYM